MKKIYCILVTVLSFNTSFAQKLSYGLKAGFNGGFLQSNPEVKNAGILPTFHAGIFAEYALNENISIQPSLLFNGRGTTIEHKDHHDDLLIYTLDLPIQLLYRTHGFFAGGGFIFGNALSGHSHTHDSLDRKVEQEVYFGSGAGEYKRLNYGLNISVGYELKNGFFASTGIIYNLNNWRNISTVNQKFHVLVIGVGYRFK
ncbi:MAG: porin family protein [Bacteroidia bacterium]